MGTLKLQGRNGAVVNVSPDDNSASETKITLPKKSGSIATLDDVQEALADFDVEALSEVVEQVARNTEQIEKNRLDILNLGLPSNGGGGYLLDIGEWQFHPPVNAEDYPAKNTFYFLDKNGDLTDVWLDVKKVRMSWTDLGNYTHRWDGFERPKNLQMELFNTSGPGFGLFILEESLEADWWEYYREQATFNVQPTVSTYQFKPAGIVRMKIVDNT
jgi:hypothetical protein